MAERAGAAVIQRVERVEVIAHKGAHNPDEAGGAENTLAAFERAVEIGVDWVEFDVNTTADGHLVVIHDGSVDRTTNGSGEVERFTLDELRSLDAGDGQHVPTLDETLELLLRGRAGAYLEIKDAEPTPVVAALRRRDMVSRTVVYSRPDSLPDLRRIDPYIRLMANRPPSDADELSRVAESIRPEVYGSSLRDISAEQAEAVHAVGGKLFVNAMAVDDPSGWSRVVELGGDALETDRPEACLAWLRESGLHP